MVFWIFFLNESHRPNPPFAPDPSLLKIHTLNQEAHSLSRSPAHSLSQTLDACVAGDRAIRTGLHGTFANLHTYLHFRAHTITESLLLGQRPPSRSEHRGRSRPGRPRTDRRETHITSARYRPDAGAAAVLHQRGNKYINKSENGGKDQTVL